jgi:hypothetical protein
MPAPSLAAVHEAGHCVAQILRGGSVVYAEVRPGRPRMLSAAAANSPTDAAILALAGAAGELVIFGREHAKFRRPSNLDWQDVQDELRKYPAGLRAVLYRKWKAAAVRLIARNRAAVLRVARELDRRGRMTGDEVAEVILTA